jgi:hypothetical protein
MHPANGAGGAGTGILVSNKGPYKYVLTAAHVVSEQYYDILFRNNHRRIGELVASNRAIDLALFRFRSDRKYVAINVASSISNGPYTLAGYPRAALPLRYRNAQFIGGAYADRMQTNKVNIVTTNTYSGESGGAVLENGKLVGVLLASGGYRTVCAPFSAIRGFLSQYCQPYQPPQPVQPAPTQPITPPSVIPPNGDTPITPPTPITPSPSDNQAEWDKINNRIDSIEQALKNRMKGDKGDAGAQGVAGDTGPAGFSWQQ